MIENLQLQSKSLHIHNRAPRAAESKIDWKVGAMHPDDDKANDENDAEDDHRRQS